MRKRFDKSPAIDAASNLRLVDMIQNHDGDYSEREEEILEEGKKMLEVFEQQKSKELKMASHTSRSRSLSSSLSSGRRLALFPWQGRSCDLCFIGGRAEARLGGLRGGAGARAGRAHSWCVAFLVAGRAWRPGAGAGAG